MTSEIAVMNQRAIALAADSAVTTIDGGKVIVRNDQRKLFNLADGVPVGIMFFGLADLMGHPWDVLAEHYRVGGGKGTSPHVRDYGERFFQFLDTLDSFFPRSRQKDEYKRLTASVFRYIFRFAQYLHETGMPGPDQVVLARAVELVWNRYRTYPDGRPRRDLSCFPPGFAVTLEKDYGNAAEDLIDYAFGAFSPDRETRQRLREIAVLCVVKDLFLEDVTGLVFAGYGNDEPYPVIVTYNASAVIGGIVKRARVEETRVDGDMHAAISLYADSEVTYAFLRGIEVELEAHMYGTFGAMGGALVDKVVESFGNVDPVERESIRRRFQSEQVPDAVRQCYDTVNAFQQEAYIDPVLATVEVSTRNDLAETAHGLVALNIFKKRIMAQDQTVGGAIDVAVINRDNGFTWWKRQGA